MPAPSVAVVAFDGISPFHLSVPSLVLGPESPPGESEPWPIEICAERPGPLRTSAEFTIDVPHGLEALERADIVIVPWWGDPSTPAPGVVVAAIRAAHERGAMIVGLCLGVFPVADAGVLDGHRATTHWKWADTFRARFPLVKLDPAALYVDEETVLTGAGASAGIDTCLHLLATRNGQGVANRVARRIVAPPHRRGGQAQFIEQPTIAETDDPVGRACEWAIAHLDAALSIDTLATRAHLSRSTFTRYFRKRTGTTVARWVAQQRVIRARELLESSDLPIEAIADACGFTSAAILREHFRAELDTTPAGYREAFQAAEPVGAQQKEAVR
ncbi:GlxA family transcriptional regulator [Leucobacter iarius]|uniref:Helix-turn-helix domain-containing protein n=1 Tax=Leucobacter iarius TaxID=333963 RepID=A0ABP4Y6G2_9MICO